MHEFLGGDWHKPKHSGFYINQVTRLFHTLGTPILCCQVANQHQVVVALYRVFDKGAKKDIKDCHSDGLPGSESGSMTIHQLLWSQPASDFAAAV